MVAVLPTMLLADFLGNAVHMIFVYLGMTAVIAEVISLIVTTIQVRTFLCPRCEKPFTVSFAFGPNTLGRECVHCGLKANEKT